MPIILDPSSYGASPLSSDNSSALNAWFSALMSTAGAQGQINENYKHASTLLWDFDPRPWGTQISFAKGAGKLTYTGTSGKALHIYRSGGTGTGNIKSVAGLLLENFDCVADVAGVAYQIGKDDGSDVFESCEFIRHRIINLNSSGNANAVTQRIVGMNTSLWTTPIFNGKPATSSYAGAGVALELAMVTSTVFDAPSPSNANTAIRYTNLGNSALGFTHGNTFNSPDIENVQNAVIGESGPYAWENYRGGNCHLVYPGGYVATSKAGFYGSSIPSAALTFECPAYPFSVHPTYSGGVRLLV